MNNLIFIINEFIEIRNGFRIEKKGCIDIVNKLIQITNILLNRELKPMIKELIVLNYNSKKYNIKKPGIIELLYIFYKYEIIDNVDFIENNILDVNLKDDEDTLFNYIFLFDSNIRFIILFYIRYNLILYPKKNNTLLEGELTYTLKEIYSKHFLPAYETLSLLPPKS